LKHPTIQVIERNEALFEQSASTVFIAPPEGPSCTTILGSTVICFSYRAYNDLCGQGCEQAVFGPEELTGQQFDNVVVFVSKAKDELEMILDLAESLLAKEGRILLVGEKKGGVAGASKRLIERSDECVKIDSAKHCQLWEATGLADRKGFNIADYMHQFSLTVADVNIEIASLPGVFASGRLDEGTELLLTQNIRRLKGRTLDFGCGCGVIGTVLKKKNPDITLEAIDISWLALQATAATWKLNDIDGSVYPSDGWSDVKGRVNGVVTNPPFHQGVSTEYSTTERFIKQAHDKLAKYAPVYIVANGFLRYPEQLEKTFGRYMDIAKNSKFKVYYAER